MRLIVALIVACSLVVLAPTTALADTTPKELRVVFVDSLNQPIPSGSIKKFVCRDLIDEPILVTKTVENGLGTVVLPEDGRPVEVCAKLAVPGFGEVVVFADNNRRGYTEAGTIDFVTEAAITRLRRVESAVKKATAEGVVMPQSFHDNLAAAATLAPYPSLALSMAAGEEVALAIARHRISHYSGPRVGFLFGCNTFGHPGRGSTYDVRFRELFNFGTTNMYLTKYAPTETTRDYSRTDLENDWLISMGMTPRTSAPFYLSSGVTPQWLKDKTWPSVNQVCHDLIKGVCQRYAGKTPVCEVTNEATFSNSLSLTTDQIIQMTATASTASREGDPNIQRMLNSSTIWGDTAAKPDKFGNPVLSPYAYLKRCIDEGVDFEITGLQMYYPEVDLLEIDRMLERYATLGKRIHITEMGCSSAPGLDPNAQRQTVSANWHGEWSESVQAEWVEGVYSIFYSKPYIDAVSWWDLADAVSFWPYGGLCRGDLSPKLSYTRLQGLLQQWGYLDAGSNCTCKVTGPASPTNQSPITFSIDFGKSVTGLTAGEIVVTGGTKGALTGSARSYRLVVTPSSDTNVTCKVPAGAALDPAGNSNAVSNTAVVGYARLVCAVSAARAAANASPIEFAIKFSDSVTGLTAAKVSVTGGDKGALSGGGSTYTIPVTPTAAAVTARVFYGSATDSAGHKNATSNLAQVTYDTSAPSCVVATSESLTSERLVDFTLDFSEPVDGFTMDDVMVTGAAKVELITVGTHNILTVAPTADGVVSCHVPAGAAMDAGQNPNLASNAVSFMYDATPPSTVAVADEGTWTPSRTTLRATWSAAGDGPGSGVSGYEYAIGTAPIVQNVRGWTPIGNVTSVVDSSLSMTSGARYHVQVRATDNAGLVGAASSSNGIFAAPAVSSIGQAWGLSDAIYGFSLRNKVVTAVGEGAFWLEDAQDRSGGMKVISNAAVSRGNTVNVAGVLGISGTQRVLFGDIVENLGGNSGLPKPVGMTQRDIGGSDFNARTPGVTGGKALYNIGMLVRCWGRVTYRDTTDPQHQYFDMDDGSRASDGGARVLCGSVVPPAGGVVAVTGVVASELRNGKVVPVIVARDADDIRSM